MLTYSPRLISHKKDDMSIWCLKHALLPPSGEKTTTMNTALRTCNHTVNNALRALLAVSWIAGQFSSFKIQKNVLSINKAIMDI